MKNIRIGKDIALAWAIRTSNDEKLSDIELSIDMKARPMLADSGGFWKRKIIMYDETRNL